MKNLITALTLLIGFTMIVPAQSNEQKIVSQQSFNDKSQVISSSFDSKYTQQAFIKASNTNASDTFGLEMALSEDTLVILAPNEASNATGVNGDENDNSKLASGAAYVFVREDDTWTQQAYLKASNSDEFDRFGSAVVIEGDIIAIGARTEDSTSIGINGDQSDNSINSSGAVYVFTRSGNTWEQEAYIKASNTGENDFFGSSLALSGNTLIVGASQESSSSAGVNGDEDNDLLPRAGAAYIFVRENEQWTQQAYLKASNPSEADFFGAEVAIDGDTVAISAPNEDSNAQGINGDQNNESMTDAGAVYMFTRTGTQWSQEAYIKASNTDAADIFGNKIALVGDTLAVGAVREDSDSAGINGDQNNNNSSASGAVYILTRTNGIWSHDTYIKASNPDASDGFGGSVSMSADKLLVGATVESSSARGIDGPDNNFRSRSGAAYLFTLDQGDWVQQHYIKASNTGVDDFFGWKTAISGNVFVVSAPFEASIDTGVNGGPGNTNSFFESGAAYLFIDDAIFFHGFE